ncbi:hypothetical protein EON66_06945 [archaeon]|nr:MAG: hypothetical protein EON66_06945 [archaeon]
MSVVGSGGRHVALPPTSQGQAQSRLFTTPRDSSGVLTRPSTVHLSTSRSPASLPSSPGRVAAGGRAASSRPAHSASLSALRHEASLTELSADMMVDFDFHAEHAAAGDTMVGAAFTGWQGAAHSASASVYDDGTSSPPAMSRLPPLRSAHE